MHSILKTLSIVALTSISFAAMAAPRQLITHNTTDYESNAFVASSIPSQHPTRAHSEGRVFWTAVKLACFGHIENGKCSALIMMATNTANPIPLGVVSMDMNSGEISPSVISANGFTLTVNGPGETTLSQP